MHSGLCLRVLTLAALTVPIRAAQPAPETFTLTVPDGLISTLSGSSVSLLCQVSPLFNAEPLEVRWYRSDDFHTPALLYKDHKIQEALMDPRYRGRVSLTGGLEGGNVSLTLERVTLEDRGEYVCQVTSEKWYEKASVFLTVNVMGSEPVLSVTEARGGGGGQVNVTCSSEGWSPQPTVTWRNKEGTKIRNEQDVLYTNDPQGLVSVSGWLMYSPSDSDWLSCTVSLSEERREGRILPHICIAPTTAVPGGECEIFLGQINFTVIFDVAVVSFMSFRDSNLEYLCAEAWKEAFVGTLVLSLLLLCAVVFILYNQRGSKCRNHTDQSELGQRPAGAVNTVQTPTKQISDGKKETKPLIEGAENTVQTPTKQMAAGKEVNLTEIKNSIEGNTIQTPTEHRASGKEVNLEDWHEVKEFKENIILDGNTAHPAIRVSRGTAAHYVKEKDKEHRSMRIHLYVFCKESFSSGQHYWEVTVKDQSTVKLSWCVGVARDNVERRSTVPLTPQNGFRILSYDKDNGYHVNTDPQTPITVAEITRVGVFLDCDRHTLSFYHVDTESLLYTFTDVKTSNYFPVISPGKRDKTPIKII